MAETYKISKPKTYSPTSGTPGYQRPMDVPGWPTVMAALKPYSKQAITTFGEKEYQQALADWRESYGDYSSMTKEITPQVQEMMGYYRPGGGYGGGRRIEAEEAVRGGVATDIGSMVSAGMSSQFGARGVGTRAGAELSKLYKNIEDTRAQLQMKAFEPYAQIMAAIANMMQARPSYGQEVKPVVTTQTGAAWF